MYLAKPKAYTLFITCSLTLQSLLMAQDGNRPDLKSIAASLEAIKQKQTAALASHRNSTYQDFRAASADNGSALAFYQEAMRNTAFVGQNREQTEFHEWKKKEGEKQKDPTFQNAVRLQLAWIVITMERGNGVSVKKLMPELLAYVADANSAGQSLKTPFMKNDITSSIFVDWYQIRDWLQAADNWDMKPSDINGIFEKIILPEMREEKDPRAVQYWDDRISIAADNAAATKLTFDVDKFNQIERPALQWSRAKEMLAIGQTNNGITSMFAVIKENPEHPSAGDWIAELQDVIKGATPAPAPSAAPAPPTPQASAAPLQ